MSNINELIKQWEFEADNDGNPPKITEEERQELAQEYLKAMTERKKIGDLPIFGVSEKNYRRAQYLDHRIGVTFNFLRETLMDGAFVPDELVKRYVDQVRTNG